MRHRPARRLAGAAILVLAGQLGLTRDGSAQEKGVPSDATAIPTPPPAPPPRPTELAPPAQVEAPRPPERPAELSPPAEAAKAREAEPVKPTDDGEVPAPPPRPAELSAPALAITVVPVDDGACRRRLERLGARFEPLPAIANGQCGAARPLKVTALADDLALAPPVTLVCEAAESLARWTTEAQVAAERDLGQPLKGLTIGTSYECRGQNHDPDAKLSEHSFANGVDVMGFTFAHRPALSVLAAPEGTPEATFLAAVRGRACAFFRTVLGPGSDAAHANHLHLDERQRNAGHRLCQ
ncbi:extensin family protein [Methylobacterium sp. Leaf111]|uniref:extensin-like domain-containing protein n=1 Tax=Methylobacterium sp. Leaf111 TaxID=1736257 RepID=UPI0009EB18D3|nr:extensin family protein [Methylobacterium sp. Leaf111]